MTTGEFGEGAPSDSCARDVFKAVAELTTMQGKYLTSSAAFGPEFAPFPDAIAGLFDDIDEGSISGGRCVFVTQNISATGLPLREGVVAQISFIQSELVDLSLKQNAQFSFRVISDGENLRLEKHSSIALNDPTTGMPLGVEEAGRTLPTDEAKEALEEIFERTDAAKEEERQMGLLEVSPAEGEAILEILSYFLANPKQ